jgi:DNA-binding transcriptional regulator GbsR (MarR family)
MNGSNCDRLAANQGDRIPPHHTKNMTDQNIDIAKGKILGFLLLSKQPVTTNIPVLAAKLQLTPELISAALRQLEDDLKVTVTTNRAIIALVDAGAEAVTA